MSSPNDKDVQVEKEIELRGVGILGKQPMLFDEEEGRDTFAEKYIAENADTSLKDEADQVRLNICESTSIKSNISSIEFVRLYADKKGLFLAAEYILLISCIAIGSYLVYQEHELVRYLQDKKGFEKTVTLVGQAQIMTILVTLVMGLRLLTNCIFGLLFILFKRGVIVNWINVFKSKLFIDQIFIWQSPFISLPIIIIALIRLMVNCKSHLEEIKLLQGSSSFDIEVSDLALNKLSFIIIYHSVYLPTNFIMEQLVVRRQYLGNVIQSQRLGILDYSIAYIGNAAFVASLVLYFFRFRYSDSAESNIDLRSQVDYYYKTVLVAAAHSGIISVFLGILGYIASLSCSKMLILISLIVKFYSAFIFSWSCSLVWFGNQLLKLFCNIDSISQNITSLPSQDYLAFKNACFTRPNFYLVTVLVIIQLSLSIITLLLNFLFLINKKIWKTEY